MGDFRITNRRPIKYLFGFLLIFMVISFSAQIGAQFLPYSPIPLYNPLAPYLFGNPFLQPYIRINPFNGFGGLGRYPVLPPLATTPGPVVRRGNTTITIWNTVGKTTTLLIYNPTLLIGPTAAPVTPSPLLSLLAGQLLVFGESPLSTVNPFLFNYLVNTYLLPTGLSFFAI